MKRGFILAAAISLAGCGTAPEAPNDALTHEDVRIEPAASPEPVVLSSKDQNRICKAALQSMNVQKVQTMREIKAEELGVVRITYNRASDGKKWTYECNAGDGSVRIRPFDEMGPGTGPGRWWTTTSIGYEMSPKSIKISLTYPGEAAVWEDVAI